MSAKPPTKRESPADRACALIRKAQAGDAEAMAEVRTLMDQPASRQHFHDLAGRVRADLIGEYFGDDCVTRELIEREVQQLRTDLLGPDPTPAERLLAERVAIGWLEVHIAEHHLAKRSLADAPFWQRQVDHAQRRFVAALRLLAALRRLPRPAGGGAGST